MGSGEEAIGSFASPRCYCTVQRRSRQKLVAVDVVPKPGPQSCPLGVGGRLVPSHDVHSIRNRQFVRAPPAASQELPPARFVTAAGVGEWVATPLSAFHGTRALRDCRGVALASQSPLVDALMNR